MNDPKKEKEIEEVIRKMDAADFDHITNRRLRLMGVGAGDGEPSFTYTYTGQVSDGFELTVIGTRTDIAGGIINNFYAEVSQNDDRSPEVLKERLNEFLKSNGPLNGSVKGHPPVPYEVSIVSAVEDAEKYAYRRSYLSPALKEFGGVDYEDALVLRVVFTD